MNEIANLYPLRFHSFYRRKIWGGSLIYQYKGIPTPYKDVGETWEISPMDGSESIISVGDLAGKSLNEVVELYGEKLLGQHVYDDYGGKFPLLFKLIDAHETLSLQVHPDDAYAKQHQLGNGKSEAWYVLECAEGAKIYAGWDKPVEPEQFVTLCQDDSIMEYLKYYEAKPSHLYYLPAGIIHTMGAGCLMLEIQQASDVTYRVFDFFRKDDEGNCRDLHLDKALEVLDFSCDSHALVNYDTETYDKWVEILRTPHFVLGMTQFSSELLLDLEHRDSFTVCFVDQGEVMLSYPNGVDKLGKGDFILLPATLHEVNLVPVSEQVKLLDCHVPAL